MSSSRVSSSLNWKRWLRPFALTFYFLALVLAVPVVVWQLQRHNWSIHIKAWFISGIVLFFTLPVSLWGILQHVVHLSRPDLQKPIIRILWMVPVFSLASWSCLLWPDHATYMETIREFYEAFTIYNFMGLGVFYKTLKEELKPLQPLGKFACLKIVIALIYWQALVIAGLKKWHVTIQGSTWDWQTPEAVGTGILNFAIVMEMFVAAILFHYSYSYTPYMKVQRRGTFWSFFLEIWDIADITKDVAAQAKGARKCLCGNTHSIKPQKDACVIEMPSSSPDTPPTTGASPASPGNQPDLGHTLPSLY